MELLPPIMEPVPQTDQELDFSGGTAAEKISPETIGELKEPAILLRP